MVVVVVVLAVEKSSRLARLGNWKAGGRTLYIRYQPRITKQKRR